MITKEQYLKAKAIVEEYEEQEFQEGMNNALYCTECQAMLFQECICDDEEDPDAYECEFCGRIEPYHENGCPNDNSPYANLLRDGYD